MFKKFMRTLSMRSVVVTDSNGKQVLNDRVRTILDGLAAKGHDPKQQLRSCQDYLESHIHVLKRDYNKKSWEIRNKNPRKFGTLAYYKYLLENTTRILGVLIEQDLQAIFYDGSETPTETTPGSTS